MDKMNLEKLKIRETGYQKLDELKILTRNFADFYFGKLSVFLFREFSCLFATKNSDSQNVVER